MPQDAEPGLRDRKKARRRDDIIAAAIELFGKKGVDATTIADIAEACDVSAPTIFNYFGSKDGILVALVEEGTQRKRERGSRRPRLEGFRWPPSCWTCSLRSRRKPWISLRGGSGAMPKPR
ncbi:TetR/AcrR family transcriptional regulator [Sulfitobacter porphyrae]|uniref:TetR/AcrR family transcriptional regulator n=1 Tax=Sulfitobacter porphyrae TaxID=1246864 RepID=A0ABW2BAB0_9RHOB